MQTIHITSDTYSSEHQFCPMDQGILLLHSGTALEFKWKILSFIKHNPKP